MKLTIKEKLISGGAWALFGKVLSMGATLAGNVLLARILSPEELGSYFLAFSVVTIFALCGQWGLNRGLVKLVAAELAAGCSEIARRGITASFGIVLAVSVILALLFASPAGEWFLGVGFKSTLLVSLSTMLGLWILIKSLQGVVSESFRGLHDIRFATIFGGLATAIISMLLYLSLWIFQERVGLDQVVLMAIVAAGGSLIIGLLCLFREMAVLKRGGHKPVFDLLRFGFPLMLTSFCLLGVKEFHIWILGVFQPKGEVALYGTAMRLVTIMVMPLTIVNAVIPPIVADLYSRKHYTLLQGVLQEAATILSVPSIIAFGLILMFGDDVLVWVYGEPYRAGFAPLVVLAGGQVANILTGSPGILLTMSGHERIVMVSAIGGGIIGIAVSFIGAQKFGAVGAAAGFSAGIAIVNYAMWFYSARHLAIYTNGNLMTMKNMLVKIFARIEYRWGK